jgi:hypothetical protein
MLIFGWKEGDKSEKEANKTMHTISCYFGVKRSEATKPHEVFQHELSGKRIDETKTIS